MFLSPTPFSSAHFHCHLPKPKHTPPPWPASSPAHDGTPPPGCATPPAASQFPTEHHADGIPGCHGRAAGARSASAKPKILPYLFYEAHSAFKILVYVGKTAFPIKNVPCSLTVLARHWNTAENPIDTHTVGFIICALDKIDMVMQTQVVE